MHKYNMSQQEGTETLDRKEMLSKLLNYKDNPETVEQEVIKSMLQRSCVKVSDEIMHGDVNVFDPNNIIQEVGRLREKRRHLESILQKLDASKHQQEAKALKREIIKLKMEEGELTKKEAKIKTKDIVEKVKKWEEIQQEIRFKKEKQEQARQKQINEELFRQKKEQAKLQKTQRLQKKRQIAQKLKKIEQYRLKRQEIIKFSQSQYSKLHPKYLQIEKRYKKLQEQVTFQKDIFKKNHKLNQKIDHSAIKQHQKNYMTQVHERIQKRKSLQTISDHDFTPFIYRNQDKISQDKEKLKRRREFQKKLKEIPIDVDEKKKMKIQIARDKGKNPVKYHFLSQKALDDHQIYGEFQDFQIKTNPRELGKEYLKELPSITQGSRVTKSQSLNTLSERTVSQKERYKDYLQELKSQRGSKNEVTEQQLVSSMLRSNSQHKSKLLQRLDERSRKYELQTLKRREQLEGYNNLQSSIKKSKQLDQVYVKSLKAKLACIEIKD